MRRTWTNTLVALVALSFLGGSALAAPKASSKVKKAPDQEFTYKADGLSTDLLTPVPIVTGIRRTPRKSLIQLRYDFIDRIVKSTNRI